MADLARILALPPPRSFGTATQAVARQLRPADTAGGGSAGSGLPVAPSETATGSTDQESAGQESAGQAKRFRFRVYDGAGRDTQSADLQRYQNGAANGQARGASGPAGGASGPQPQTGGRQDQAGAAGRSEPKAVATFLAQLISQEQLGQGLHAPPIRAADIAYRRAGAEPSIEIGSPARFSLAV